MRNEFGAEEPSYDRLLRLQALAGEHRLLNGHESRQRVAGCPYCYPPGADGLYRGTKPETEPTAILDADQIEWRE